MKESRLLQKWIKSDYFALSLIMLLGLLFFNIIAYCVLNIEEVSVYDKSIVVSLHNFAVHHSTIIPVFITNLGYGASISFFLLVSILFLSFLNRYKEAVTVTLITISSTLSMDLIKNIFKRQRPPVEYRIMDFPGYSFPSGHSFISMCFYGILIYLIFKYVDNKFLKYPLSALLCLLILLIGISRVYVGLHYPLDVVGGFCLGLFWIAFWLLIIKILSVKTRNLFVLTRRRRSTAGQSSEK